MFSTHLNSYNNIMICASLEHELLSLNRGFAYARAPKPSWGSFVLPKSVHQPAVLEADLEVSLSRQRL